MRLNILARAFSFPLALCSSDLPLPRVAFSFTLCVFFCNTNIKISSHLVARIHVYVHWCYLMKATQTLHSSFNPLSKIALKVFNIYSIHCRCIHRDKFTYQRRSHAFLLAAKMYCCWYLYNIHKKSESCRIMALGQFLESLVFFAVWNLHDCSAQAQSKPLAQTNRPNGQIDLCIYFDPIIGFSKCI